VFPRGLLARTSLADRLIKRLESSVLSKIPAYEYLKQVSASILGLDDLEKHPAVLAQFEGAWKIGIQIEGSNNGLVTVFVPNAPNLHTGSVYLLAPERVKLLDAPLATTLTC
jgi:uncharacterized membrane protein